MLFGDAAVIDVPGPTKTEIYPAQESYDTRDAVSLDQFGETTDAPLGSIALGRSGDKASDANVGFFVATDEQWDWLRSVLTIDKLKELLGPDEYSGNRVDRFEMGNIRAVHFLLKDHLDRGYNSGKLDGCTLKLDARTLTLYRLKIGYAGQEPLRVLARKACADTYEILAKRSDMSRVSIAA